MFQVQISAVAIYILLGLLFTEMRVCISRIQPFVSKGVETEHISKISVSIIAEMD